MEVEGTSDAQRAANYMAAVAHLLSGAPGRHEEFIEKVELVVCGRPLRTTELGRLADAVRADDRPLLCIHLPAEDPSVPRIGLFAKTGGTRWIVESCTLWMRAEDRQARLVPDSFEFGSFRFADDLTLSHDGRTPPGGVGAARANIDRACRRLREIEERQIADGATFRLPDLTKAA